MKVSRLKYGQLYYNYKTNVLQMYWGRFTSKRYPALLCSERSLNVVTRDFTDWVLVGSL